MPQGVFAHLGINLSDPSTPHNMDTRMASLPSASAVTADPPAATQVDSPDNNEQAHLASLHLPAGEIERLDAQITQLMARRNALASNPPPQ
jgi:hypothetical protein